MARSPGATSRGSFLAGLLGCVVVSLVLAWIERAVVDDAFIYFRYAENFANGRGLVWNVGERVDGATSFLWTVLLGLAMKAGIAPLTASFALGLLTLVA